MPAPAPDINARSPSTTEVALLRTAQEVPNNLVAKDKLSAALWLAEQRRSKGGAERVWKLAQERPPRAAINAQRLREDLSCFGAGAVNKSSGQVEYSGPKGDRQEQVFEAARQQLREKEITLHMIDCMNAGDTRAQAARFEQLWKQVVFSDPTIDSLDKLLKQGADIFMQDPVVRAIIDDINKNPDLNSDIIKLAFLKDPAFQRVYSEELQRIHVKLGELPDARPDNTLQSTQQNSELKTDCQLVENGLKKQFNSLANVNGIDDIIVKVAATASSSEAFASAIAKEFALNDDEVKQYFTTPPIDAYVNKIVIINLSNDSQQTGQGEVNQSQAIRARLDAEEAVVADLEGSIGRAVAQIMDSRSADLDSALQAHHEREQLGSQDQALARINTTIESSWTAYNGRTRQREIFGDRIINDMRYLTAFGESGLRYLMAHNLRFLAPGDVVNGKTSQDQHIALNNILGKLTTEQKALLDGMMEKKGREYRTKLISSYFEMKSYLKEGINGHKLRAGCETKVRFVGHRSVGDYLSGRLDINQTEWDNLYRAFGNEVDEAIKTVPEGRKRLAELQEKGIVVDSKKKFLLWILLLTLGTIMIPGGLGTAIGAGAAYAATRENA